MPTKRMCSGRRSRSPRQMGGRYSASRISSASSRASDGPRNMAVSCMLFPELQRTVAETAVIERPVLDAGNDDTYDRVANFVRREVDDDDLIESAGFEAFE